MSYVGKVNTGQNDHLVAASVFGTCSTAADVAAKIVVLDNFDALMNGVTIQVKFVYSNTASNPTLNVNNTGAKPIYLNGTNPPGVTALLSWSANSVLSFTYDGTAWIMNDVNKAVVDAVDRLNAGYNPVSKTSGMTKAVGNDSEGKLWTEPVATSEVQTAANTWLSANITNPDSPPLDRSLSSNVSAAPADMVGDLKNTINNALQNQMSVVGYGENVAFNTKLIIGTRSTTGILAYTAGSTALNTLFPVEKKQQYKIFVEGATNQTLVYYFYSSNDETTMVEYGMVAMSNGSCEIYNNVGTYASFQISNVEMPGEFVYITLSNEATPLYPVLENALKGYLQSVPFSANVGLLSGNVNGTVSINTGATRYSYAVIDVKPDEVYRFSCVIDGAANHIVRFVNSSGKILQRLHNGVNSYMVRYEGNVTAPKNATKMYINWCNAYDISVHRLGLIESDNLYSVEELNVAFKTGLVTGCSAFTPTVSNNTDYKHAVLKCSPGDKFKISGVYSGASNIFLAELDESGNIIVATEIVGTDDVISAYNAEYTVSASGYGLVLCGLYAYPFTIKKAIYKTNAELNNDIETAIKGAGVIGKTAVVFGTSIPAGKVTVNGKIHTIPSYMGELLGMTVFNEALGSSCARRGWRSEATENDPYGWTNHAWQNVFLSMGKNLTECEDLITNYNTKWKDLIGGDFAPAGQDDTGLGKPNEMDEYWAGKIRASSYENKLIPYLDGTYAMPDLFIFEHGHNDVDTYNNQYDEISGIASVNPDNIADLDRSLFGDVMAFFIRLIWQANPTAKILIVSNYENDSAVYQHCFTAQKNVAESNKVNFCDVADIIGWSAVKKVTTTGYWSNGVSAAGVWVPSGGESQTITCLATAFPDKVHPHLDQSGKAVFREAEIIANYIRTHITLE